MKNSEHLKYLKKALKLAKKAEGHVSPNPLVGAVLVKKNKIIGKGWHKKHGDHHAEVNAINSAKESVKNATLYSTLEPCCHSKKLTPPCCDLIIKSGIKKVVIGALDPNPKVNGKGVKKLEAAGIKVISNLIQEDENILNEVFHKNIKTNLPFVHLKIAQTLDGKIATSAFDSKWITDEEARKLVHHMRGKYDAICVGKNTIDKDNPSLNVRYGLDKKYSQPKVVILGKPKTALSELNIFKYHAKEDIYFFDHEETSNGFLEKLMELNIYSLLVEGGSQVCSYFLENNMVDRLTLFQSANIIGKGLGAFDSIENKLMSETLNFKLSKIRQLNNQLILDLYPDH